jgi:hypothetical protein
MVELAFQKNNHGAGFAWREDDGKVHWKKGMIELEDCVELCATLPIPYVAHFRLNSIGGIKSTLCHPFPISPGVELDLEGETDGSVLFHNGTWSQWRDFMVNLAMKNEKAKIPVGAWNDTRAMALAAYHLGPGFVEILDEKAIIFGPVGDPELFFGRTGWDVVEGIWCSNDHFKRTITQVHGVGGNWSAATGWTSSMCHSKTCTRKDIDESGYCPEHTTTKIAVKTAALGSTAPAPAKTVRELPPARPIGGGPALHLTNPTVAERPCEPVGGAHDVVPFAERMARKLAAAEEFHKHYKETDGAIGISKNELKRVRKWVDEQTRLFVMKQHGGTAPLQDLTRPKDGGNGTAC